MEQFADHFAGRRTVAVVDDDPAVRSSLKFALETEGLEVCALAAGKELIELLGQEPICCYVIEYRLQDISGLDLADRLRQTGIEEPIVLLASHPSRTLRKSAAQRNIPIVEKPLMGSALSDTLRQLIG